MTNVAANRSAIKWTRKEQAGRILWALFLPLFFLSPRLLWGWRRVLLRLFKARIGKDVHIYPTVKILIPWNLHIDDDAGIGDHVILYALGSIHIGEGVTVSQGVHLCAGTHDYNYPDMPLLKVPIKIGDSAWICADAYIGPGVTVGERGIVGARAVVTKNVDREMIVAGNPAKIIRKR